MTDGEADRAPSVPEPSRLIMASDHADSAVVRVGRSAAEHERRFVSIVNVVHSGRDRGVTIVRGRA